MSCSKEPVSVLTLASGDLWAGAEAVVHQLALGLREKPHIEHTVVLLNHGRLETLCAQAGINTQVIDESRHGFAAILARLIAICRAVRPQLIHSHRYKENLLAALASLACGRPRLVTTVHGLSEGHNNTFKSTLKGRVNRFLMRRAFDTTVAVSNDIASALAEKAGAPAHRIITIFNGIDTHGIPPVNTKPRRDTITIGSAGRLFPVKDYSLMVDIARLTCEQRPAARFVLAGEGPEKGAILNKIKACGLDNRFALLGHVDDMQAFYAGLDIYINTSMHDGMPMTVLEAMARRIPVVAFAVGGLSEIISHAHDGYLIQNRDAQEFSQLLIDLIDDRDRLQRFGDNAGSTVHKRFSTTRMTESYCSTYTRLLGNRP
ncbi:MAG: glycosyltransferase family 4 protein [Desulfomonilia bacterium]